MSDIAGYTPLHKASYNRHLDIVQLLIENGADVNARDENGKTPLHIASGNGRLETVQILIENEAGVNAMEDKAYKMTVLLGEKWTALDFAEYKRAKKVIELLKQYGAKSGAELDPEGFKKNY